MDGYWWDLIAAFGLGSFIGGAFERKRLTGKWGF